MNWDHFWKENWEQTRERYTAWWSGDGMVLHVLAPRDTGLPARDDTQSPFYYLMAGLDIHDHYRNPEGMAAAWVDPQRRARRAEQNLQGIYFGGDAVPFFDTHIGPGSLATFIGSNPKFAEETIWYEPVITDPANHPPLRFDPENTWYLKQKALLEEGMRVSQGRFLVGMPDLIENLDTLASLRDTQMLMMDMLERPAFVKQRIAEINQVYFEVFQSYFDIIRDPWGGNIFSAFAVWGPGKTAKVQCDAAAMISPQMFAEFVAPGLTEQCAWLDYSIYHLDGTQAIPVLDTLLQIEPLNAIEWTPQISLPQGGDPMWYDLYRRIRRAGKSVQAIGVKPHEVIPLLDAVGSSGMFVMVTAESESQARALVEAVERL
jgi:hypothetical protein